MWNEDEGTPLSFIEVTKKRGQAVKLYPLLVLSIHDDLSYYTYIDNICFLYGANKKIKKFYGCYFSIDKMSSNELEKMEQFLNSKNLRPRSLLF